jgi:hypothetical protein
MLPADGGPDDCELLRRMADHASERSARREAWGVFYERHAKYVHRKCVAAHSKLIGIENVTDAVSDTFLRAYEKSATFRLSGASAQLCCTGSNFGRCSKLLNRSGLLIVRKLRMRLP